MRMALLTFLAWFVVTLIGAGIIRMTSNSADREEYVVVRELPANHRLVEGDVAEVGAFERVDLRKGEYTRFLIPDEHTRSDFRGRYLPSAMSRHQKIRLYETLAGPHLSPTGMVVWVGLSDLPPSEVASLDVGHTISVCVTGAACEAHQVDAIACTDLALGGCSAAIDVDANQLSRLTGTVKNDKYVAPHIVVAIPGGSTHAAVPSRAVQKQRPGETGRPVDARHRSR